MKQQTLKQQFPYLVETENSYIITVLITFYIQAPDYTSWDSDYDYYGFTEIVDAEIINVLIYDEKTGKDIEVQFNQLSKDEQQKIKVIIDGLIKEQEPYND